MTSRAAVSTARAFLRCGALIILGFATYSAARLACADHLSRSTSLSNRELAVRLAALPVFYERLAEKRERAGGDPLADFQQAARLEPANPERWIRLAAAAEWDGNFALAVDCLRSAAALSRLYQPRLPAGAILFPAAGRSSLLPMGSSRLRCGVR